MRTPPSTLGTLRRAALVLLGLLGTAFVLAAPAAAHATVVSSDPADGSRLKAAPSSVTITFDESVGLGGVGYLHVTDQGGVRVDAGPSSHAGSNDTKIVDRLKPGLRDGAYTASFRVVSADSHPVAGTIRFVVGNGALVHGSIGTNASLSGTGQTFGLVRWISYAGVALLGGAWLLLIVWPAGRGDTRARRVVWAGWGLTVGGAVLELLIQGPYSAGSGIGRLINPTLLDGTLHSDYGLLHCLRLILLGALAVLFARALQPDERQPDGRGRALPVLAGLLGIGVVLTFSDSGHAASTSPTWLSITMDALHIIAMAVWLGGLAILVAGVLPRSKPAELRDVLPVFSKVAFIAVVTLAVTGTYSAWRGVGTIDAWRTPYGLFVLGKVLLFIGLVALGNVSRKAVQRRAAAAALEPAAALELALAASGRPAMRAGSNEPPDTSNLGDDPDWDDVAIETERLRRSVSFEVFLGVTVLFLTGFLVALPRGKEALAETYREPVTATATLGGGRHVTVVADPGTHGPVQLSVAVDNGARVSVTAQATQRAQQIGPLPVDLTRRAARTFDGSVSLPVAGAWRIDLIVSTSDLDAVTADVTLTLH